MRDRASRLSVLALVALLPVACGGQAEAPAPPPSTAAAAPAAPAEATAGEFGVAECDDYFTKYFACIDANVPEAARATVRAAAEQSRAALQQAASTEAGADALKSACSTQMDAAKQAMAAYDCQW